MSQVLVYNQIDRFEFIDLVIILSKIQNITNFSYLLINLVIHFVIFINVYVCYTFYK